jgi:glyoxylase-like metal-dependent hydrolase (beta-lactamase superfamily II)
MIKHKSSTKNFSGYHQFPWAKINKNDVKIQSNHEVFSAHQPHLMACLRRNLKKTMGYDLEETAQSNQVKQIQSIAAVLYFDVALDRYRIHFFIIHLKEKPVFAVTPDVAAEAGWKSPDEYVRLYQKGKMVVLPGILNLLKALQTGMIDEIGKNFTFYRKANYEIPWFQPMEGIQQLLPISFTYPPYIIRTNCFIIGDPGEKRFAIDPSSHDDGEYKKLLAALKESGFTAIFITHHHPDHHQGAAKLARDLAIPITISKDSYQRILKRKGKNYFKNLEINFAKEGDLLTRWLGKKVKVYEIPGHDEGQLALAPESLEWFLVGDLIQEKGAGAVVIGGEEGDMTKYYRSLERIIRLNPGVLLPSHGMLVTSTHRLKQTLKQLDLREKRVLALYKKGNTPRQISKIIYYNVEQKRLRFGLQNIKSHLKKLQQEGVIKNRNTGR